MSDSHRHSIPASSKRHSEQSSHRAPPNADHSFGQSRPRLSQSMRDEPAAAEPEPEVQQGEEGPFLSAKNWQVKVILLALMGVIVTESVVSLTSLSCFKSQPTTDTDLQEEADSWLQQTDSGEVSEYAGDSDNESVALLQKYSEF